MESTVEEVMAVEASLTVVLESWSAVYLDIMRGSCDLHTHKGVCVKLLCSGSNRQISEVCITPTIFIYWNVVCRLNEPTGDPHKPQVRYTF